jgi:uncharacterized protein (DUF1697 family)
MTDAGTTTTYVALLRGINLGKSRRISMADLRAAIEDAGFEDVRTLLASGNVVLTGPSRPTPAVATVLERVIEARFAMKVRVVIRTADELARIMDANPIPEAQAYGTYLHVLFLDRPLTTAERRSLDPDVFPPDEVRAGKREVYIWYRNGMSGSGTADELGRRIGAVATDRNWNTLTKLVAIARAG